MRTVNQRVAKEIRTSYPFREKVIVFPAQVGTSIGQETAKVVSEREVATVGTVTG